jgi:hypothetical protein
LEAFSSERIETVWESASFILFTAKNAKLPAGKRKAFAAKIQVLAYTFARFAVKLKTMPSHRNLNSPSAAGGRIFFFSERSRKCYPI